MDFLIFLVDHFLRVDLFVEEIRLKLMAGMLTLTVEKLWIESFGFDLILTWSTIGDILGETSDKGDSI